MPKREAEDRARNYIAKVGLDRFRDSYPHAVGRHEAARRDPSPAMATEPEILLMDEPFAALDAPDPAADAGGTASALGRRALHRAVRHPLHREAIIVGNRILVLSPHPGQVKAELNAHAYGHEKSDGFAALENRIHTDAVRRTDGGSRPQGDAGGAAMTVQANTHQQPLVPSVRPEFERDVLDAGVIGDISRPLSLWERLTGNTLARRIFILVLLGAAWQLYAVWSDNPLMFPRSAKR